MASRYSDERVRDLAAAVILQAIDDFKAGPGQRGKHRLRQLEARDFLTGRGKYENWRSMWCGEMGMSPDRLNRLVEEQETTKKKA